MKMQAFRRHTQSWAPTRCHTARYPVVHCRASGEGSNRKTRLMFLGTPDVAAIVLQELVKASRLPDAAFEVVGVVSQPGKPRGRGNKSTPQPTPVQEAATALGLHEQVLAPHTAKDEQFLQAVAALQPDLCITAAYGNMLPQRFLDIPRLGTLNIHPSLLPKYRGAAPVQRCLQSGDAVGGVSVAYTVLKCDAGPVLAQKQAAIDPNIQAPELLASLFQQGAALLLEHLPKVLAGQGLQLATPQDNAAATHADKLSKEDSVLDFDNHAAASLHNTVRGLAGWPGTVGRFLVQDEATGAAEPMELRIIRTAAPTQHDLDTYQGLSLTQPGQEVGWPADGSGDMLVPCACSGGAQVGSVLRVTHVQPPTKKVMQGKDFRNGLRRKRLLVARQVTSPAGADVVQQAVQTGA